MMYHLYLHCDSFFVAPDGWGMNSQIVIHDVPRINMIVRCVWQTSREDIKNSVKIIFADVRGKCSRAKFAKIIKMNKRKKSPIKYKYKLTYIAGFV